MHTCDFMHLDSAEFIHHPKSLCKPSCKDSLRTWHWWGCPCPGGSPRASAAHRVCGLDGSCPDPSTQPVSITPALQTHPDPASFPLQAPVLPGFELLLLLFSTVNRVSVSLNIKAFVSPEEQRPPVAAAALFGGGPCFTGHWAVLKAGLAAWQGTGGALAGAELPFSHLRGFSPCPKGRVPTKVGPTASAAALRGAAKWLLFVSITS